MESLSYTDFSRRIAFGTRHRNIAVQGTIELSNRCPLDCAHCYNNLPMDDADARRAELSTQEYLTLLDEIADLGCLWLCFTGGEIFARRDFFEIYEYAKKKGFLITLFTNGVLIDERVADRLAAMPPFVMEITLYGRTKETYEALTRIPGSWEKCMRGIRLLLARNLPLKLKTVAVSINKHEINDMQSFAEDLGVDFKFDAMMNPRIDCSSAPLSVRLSPTDVLDLDYSDPTRSAEFRRLGKQVAPPKETPTMYECGGGVHSWALDPYGNLTICVLSHFDNFNIRQMNFAEAWDGLMNVRQKPITRPTKCTKCGLKTLCGMCPANGELENGDPEAPVDFLCHVAHLRAEAFGVEVPAHGDCEYCEGGSAYDLIVAEAQQTRAAELTK
ncbi:MAG TPA: radical SAM protein [Thermoanaerobaculia bacterium]|jgi:radical SAM protein with 4Fe4S-binding SPASM domain